MIEIQVIRHKRRVSDGFHDRVATLLNLDARFAAEARTAVIQIYRPLGKGIQHIQLRQRLGADDEGVEVLGQLFQQLVIERFFPAQGLALGAQNLVFKFLQLGRDKALGILQGLPPHILGRHFTAGLTLADLDVVTVYAVITDLQCADAGTGFFPLFQLDKKITGIAAQMTQLIELFVKPFGNDAAFANDHRGIFFDGPFQQFHLIGEFTDRCRQCSHRRGINLRQ